MRPIVVCAAALAATLLAAGCMTPAMLEPFEPQLIFRPRPIDEQHLKALAAAKRIERTPNTRAAHQLIDLAQSQGKAAPVVDALFRAYFEEAQDIGDAAVLAAIAAASGVSGWPGQANATGVAEMEESVRRLGISAVPTFIFERKLGVSGAHPPEALASAMREALPK